MSSPLIPGLVGLIVGVPIGFQIRSMLIKKTAESQRRAAGGRKVDAEREAKGIIREAEIQARAEVLKAREAFESTIKEQRKQVHDTMSALNKREEVLAQREDNLDRKSEVLDRKEQTIETKSKAVEAAEASVKDREKTAAETAAKAETTLAKLAGMTREEARKDLFEQAKQEIQA